MVFLHGAGMSDDFPAGSAAAACFPGLRRPGRPEGCCVGFRLPNRFRLIRALVAVRIRFARGLSHWYCPGALLCLGHAEFSSCLALVRNFRLFSRSFRRRARRPPPPTAGSPRNCALLSAQSSCGAAPRRWGVREFLVEQNADHFGWIGVIPEGTGQRGAPVRSTVLRLAE